MIERWRIRLLGQLSAARAEEKVDRFRTRSTGTLLAYLALFPDRAHTREQLAYLLWPEDDTATARRKLRVELSSLRLQLEPPGTPAGSVLMADRTEVRLSPAAFSTDVAEFCSAIRAAEQGGDGRAHAELWAEAVALYGGDLLPGRDEEWVLPERTRLQDRYCTALRRQARAIVEVGEVDEAAECFRRLLGIDPFREEVHRDLIHLYATSGRRPQALRQYDELCRLLMAEFQSAPSLVTQQLAEQVQAGAHETRPTMVESDWRSTGSHAPPPRQPRPSERVPVWPRHLPVPVTRFFGREAELAVLLARLTPDAAADDLSPEGRLLTITGPGGVGKSRLSLEAARRLEPHYPYVRLVSLAELPPGEGVLKRMMAALGCTTPEGLESLPSLIRFLSDKQTLLILDNAEHVTEEVAELVAQLLQGSPRLCCLVTSRQVLNLLGEFELSLAPLPLPETRAQLGELAENDCVRLFLDRARLVRPEFQLTPHNQRELQALCARLEGLPLALELAAARIRLLGLREMLGRMEHRFELIVARTRDRPARHRSLRATFDWSFDLLSVGHRRFFVALSIFRGGGTLAAVEAVTDWPGAMDALQELREASLIRIQPEGETRFTMLDSLREFAQEQGDPDDMEVLRRRWASYYAELAWNQACRLQSPADTEALERLARDEENLRASHAWALSQGRALPAARLGLGLGHLLHRRGWIADARRMVDAALPLVKREDEPELDGRLRMLRASVLLDCHDLEGAARDAEGLLTADPASGDDLRAAGHNLLGLIARARGNLAAARSHFERGLASARLAPSEMRAAMALNNLGIVEDEDPNGLPDRAREYLEQALELFRECGYRRGEAEALTNLGALAQVAAEPQAARRLYCEALEIELALQHVLGVGRLLFNLGEIASDSGETDAAVRHFTAARIILEWAGSPDAGAATELLHELYAAGAPLATAPEPEGDTWSAIPYLTQWAIG